MTIEQRVEILEAKMRFVKYLMWEQYYKCGNGQLFGEPICKECRNHGACVFATDYGQENEEETSTKRVETEEKIDNLFVDFDEMGFCPTTLCEDPEEYAIQWRNNMRNAIAKHETDLLKEFVEFAKGEFIKANYCYNDTYLDTMLEKFLEEKNERISKNTNTLQI